MSQSAKELLKFAFENYNKTNNRYYEHTCSNSQSKLFYTVAAEELEEDGYIEDVSEDFTTIYLTITFKGINYAKENL